MAFSKINSCKIVGISVCVPKNVDKITDFSLFDERKANDFSLSTGIFERRKADTSICTSDLCVSAAEKLIAELKWIKSDIDILVFVTQTPDYILPATSYIIQNKLGLSTNCSSIDISNGCSGWVYGLNTLTSMAYMQTFTEKRPIKALLLAGDTLLKLCSPEDKSTYPLFEDAGTCTAVEIDCNNTEQMEFVLHSDGSGENAIKIYGGGYRKPLCSDSLIRKEKSEGICLNEIELSLDGMDVFSFGIKRAPESVNELISNFEIDKEKIDLFTFHQANRMLNETIRKKLKLPAEKVPYSLQSFGNTSSASIPLTLVTERRDELSSKSLNHIACGFGVGLSWGAVHFSTDRIIVPQLLEI